METRMLVIKWDEDYVALDDNSGGYPYKVKLRDSKIWIEPSEVVRYFNMFAGKSDYNWVLQELEMTTKDSNILNEVTHGQFAHDQYHVGG